MSTDDTRPDLPSPHAHAQGRPGPSPADPRDPLGRLVHAERLAANAAKERPFGLLRWEERTEEQRELDMRIGEAVAAVVREQAEADLAALREALRSHTHSFTDHAGVELCGGCLRPSPCPDAALAEGGGT